MKSFANFSVNQGVKLRKCIDRANRWFGKSTGTGRSTLWGGRLTHTLFTLTKKQFPTGTEEDLEWPSQRRFPMTFQFIKRYLSCTTPWWQMNMVWMLQLHVLHISKIDADGGGSQNFWLPRKSKQKKVQELHHSYALWLPLILYLLCSVYGESGRANQREQHGYRDAGGWRWRFH